MIIEHQPYRVYRDHFVGTTWDTAWMYAKKRLCETIDILLNVLAKNNRDETTRGMYEINF